MVGENHRRKCSSNYKTDRAGPVPPDFPGVRTGFDHRNRARHGRRCQDWHAVGPRYLVAVEDGPSAETSSDGAFLLEDVASGTVRIYVSAIGYGLAQRTLVLRPKENITLQIPLSEGAATYTETVNVTADRFRRSEPGVPAQHAIGGADLQNLRGVLADDALRAVQVLPGVATGDDFRSEFTVRGSDFGHLNFTVDGFATPFLLHMVRAVEERANTGSVTMINSDALEEVTLSNGSYAQRSGNRTGPSSLS